MKTPNGHVHHPNTELHQAVAQSLVALEQTLDQADAYHQLPLFTDAFTIGAQIAQEARKSLVAAKAKMSLLPTMGVQGSALVQTYTQIALHFHWSSSLTDDSSIQTSQIEQQFNHPHVGFDHMRQLRQLGIDPMVAAWALLRPICSQALDAAREMLNPNVSFGAPSYIDRALLRAPFFCAAVLATKYQPKTQSAVELFPAPGDDWPEHFQVLCVQLAQLTIAALEFTHIRADFEERNALKTLLTQLELPAWLSIIEHNALEQAVKIPVPPTHKTKEASKRLELLGNPSPETHSEQALRDSKGQTSQLNAQESKVSTETAVQTKASTAPIPYTLPSYGTISVVYKKSSL